LPPPSLPYYFDVTGIPEAYLQLSLPGLTARFIGDPG
jgi:hypothetical protein